MSAIGIRITTDSKANIQDNIISNIFTDGTPGTGTTVAISVSSQPFSIPQQELTIKGNSISNLETDGDSDAAPPAHFRIVKPFSASSASGTTPDGGPITIESNTFTADDPQESYVVSLRRTSQTSDIDLTSVLSSNTFAPTAQFLEDQPNSLGGVPPFTKDVIVPTQTQGFPIKVTGNQDCFAGTTLIAKYEVDNSGEYVFEKPTGNKNIVSIDETSTLTSGSWESDTPIRTVIVKGGNFSSQDLADPNSDAVYSGTFSNVDLPDAGQSGSPPDISNIKFCGSTTCESATFTENFNEQDQLLTLTITNNDGIKEIFFSSLVNYEVSNPSGDFVESSQDTWTLNNGGSFPATATFELQAIPPDGAEPGQEFTASYFAEVTSDCDGDDFVTFLDPPHIFETPTASSGPAGLQGNYPNPFRDQTTINFTLPEAGEVTVSVYDISGRKVATLVNQSLTAGAHQVQWNGRSSSGQALASGVYFYRIDAGTFQDVRRLTIVR